MIDSCPFTDVQWKVLQKVHNRLDEMDRKGIDLFDLAINLREELIKEQIKNVFNPNDNSKR
jgi:hypothetical protein